MTTFAWPSGTHCAVFVSINFDAEGVCDACRIGRFGGNHPWLRRDAVKIVDNCDALAEPQAVYLQGRYQACGIDLKIIRCALLAFAQRVVALFVGKAFEVEHDADPIGRRR